MECPIKAMFMKDKRARDDVRKRSAGKTQKHTAQKTQARGVVSIWKYEEKDAKESGSASANV